MQNIIDRKWDLNYIYDMAKQALDAGDIDQAIKLSQKGLKEAELQFDAQWKPKFEMFKNNIKANSSSLKPEMAVIIKDKKDLKEGDNLVQKISQKVIGEGFQIIPQIGQGFEKILTRIDLFIIKIIKTHNSKNILLICPIIVDLIEDNLIVSEQKAKYNSLSENNLQLDTWIEELRQIQQVLLESLSQRKYLFHYLQKYLMVEMEIGDSASHNISLHSKQAQFKPYIDPLLISNSAIHFIEKSIPFAYQRRSNIHFIEDNRLIDLLSFLEKKYYNIEKFSNEEPPEKELIKAQDRYQRMIRLYSIPFAGFGAIVIILALSQLGFLLQTFIGLSYGILGIYAGMMGYLYYTFRVKQREIKNGFMIPHFKRPVPLDDTSLEIISQEFTEEFMLQFGYECFGKEATYKILTKIEQKHAENYLVEKADNDYNELFEHEKEGKSKIESEYIARFGDFLND
ncbi:MAG: hypothetical protein ACFE8M_02835 [Candidatus Hermodarchaeota archaeon]